MKKFVAYLTTWLAVIIGYPLLVIVYPFYAFSSNPYEVFNSEFWPWEKGFWK